MRPDVLLTVKKAHKLIYEYPSPLISVRAMDFLFDGIPINCFIDHFSVKAFCGGLEDLKSLVRRNNDTHLLFSFLGSMNATKHTQLTVRRGMKNIKDLGRVVQVNGEDKMKTWSTDECNQFSGTDGTIFPPGLLKDDGVTAFYPGFCRGFRTQYEKASSYAGIKTSRYIFNFGDSSKDENLYCYCNNPPDDCPPKGTYSLWKCLSAPLLVSLPHFLNADPNMLTKIDGMHPDQEKHSIKIDFERVWLFRCLEPIYD